LCLKKKYLHVYSQRSQKDFQQRNEELGIHFQWQTVRQHITYINDLYLHNK